MRRATVPSRSGSSSRGRTGRPEPGEPDMRRVRLLWPLQGLVILGSGIYMCCVEVARGAECRLSVRQGAASADASARHAGLPAPHPPQDLAPLRRRRRRGLRPARRRRRGAPRTRIWRWPLLTQRKKPAARRGVGSLRRATAASTRRR